MKSLLLLLITFYASSALGKGCFKETWNLFYGELLTAKLLDNLDSVGEDRNWKSTEEICSDQDFSERVTTRNLAKSTRYKLAEEEFKRKGDVSSYELPGLNLHEKPEVFLTDSEICPEIEKKIRATVRCFYPRSYLDYLRVTDPTENFKDFCLKNIKAINDRYRNCHTFRENNL